MDILQLKSDIEKRREDRLRAKCVVYPRNNPVASSIEECSRKMCLEMLHWKDRPVFETDVMARLEEGNRQESYVIRELMELGFTITENNPAPFEIKDKKGRIILRGRIDGKIQYGEKKYPFEVKSMMPFIFDNLNSIEDFNKYFWTKKYILQMQSYLYANNEEDGFFICTDMMGHWKIFPVKLDYALMEDILQKCEAAVEGKESGNYPEFHKDLSVCRKCWLFKKQCQPPIDFGDGVQVLDDPELEQQLKRRDELQSSVKEYDSIDKVVKTKLKEIPHAVVGNYESITKTSTVNYKATEARSIEIKKVEISKIIDNSKEEN